MTPAEFLIAYAKLSEQHPYETQSAGGDALQRALSDFLKAAGVRMDDLPAVVEDLFLLAARALIALNMADHGGAVCQPCLSKQMFEFGRYIAREELAQTSQQEQGIH